MSAFTCPRCLKKVDTIHTCTPTDLVRKLEQEIERLRHDIERHIAIASEHATECERLRAKLAEANDYINRLRDMLTDAHPCIDPSRDACNCILCELVSRDRQQAALDKEEGK